MTVNYSLHGCPCGFLGDTQHQRTCAPQQVHRYRAKISGPLFDRIDIQIEVPAVKYKELSQQTTSENSTTIRARVDGRVMDNRSASPAARLSVTRR